MRLLLHRIVRFNLVIERLLISGGVLSMTPHTLIYVSISLSSGFSFQGTHQQSGMLWLPSFNLVIERLLISGPSFLINSSIWIRVSISLSSGFSFQGGHPDWGSTAEILFQSRYRAASHFRAIGAWWDIQAVTSFNLVIERLLISGWRRCSTLHLSQVSRFNLVIERLLISGRRLYRPRCAMSMFQSRYRAASHFRT